MRNKIVKITSCVAALSSNILAADPPALTEIGVQSGAAQSGAALNNELIYKAHNPDQMKKVTIYTGTQGWCAAAMLGDMARNVALESGWDLANRGTVERLSRKQCTAHVVAAGLMKIADKLTVSDALDLRKDVEYARSEYGDEVEKILEGVDGNVSAPKLERACNKHLEMLGKIASNVYDKRRRVELDLDDPFELQIVEDAIDDHSRAAGIVYYKGHTIQPFTQLANEFETYDGREGIDGRRTICDKVVQRLNNIVDAFELVPSVKQADIKALNYIAQGISCASKKYAEPTSGLINRINCWGANNDATSRIRESIVRANDLVETLGKTAQGKSNPSWIITREHLL
jgi:hypothetical protein